ncbi:MAG: hypothetical protein ABWY12_15645 [Burkholderiales bacterium]
MQQRLETAEAVGLGALEGAELDRPGKVAAFGSDAEHVVVSKERWAGIHSVARADRAIERPGPQDRTTG